jgi:hypothetical protein
MNKNIGYQVDFSSATGIITFSQSNLCNQDFVSTLLSYLQTLLNQSVICFNLNRVLDYFKVNGGFYG